jgi:monovalent cation:H+ antiporter-2, CPA2 family
MHTNLQIVGMLTIGFALASFFAYFMQRLRLPAILGYLFAGYLIGPYSPGFIADAAVAEQLAEIGVILMLFGVGLHFKIEDLMDVKNIAIPGAIGQTLVSALCTLFLVYSLGGSLETGIIIGLSVGVASTVVLVRLLTDNNLLNTPKGHIAVGWLIVEDIFTVLILILLPSLASVFSGESYGFLDIAWPVFLSLVKFFVLAIFLFTWGHKAIEYVLTNIARLRSPSQELLTLTILAIVFLIAMSSAVLFGTSIALGAFLAGMVIGKTNIKHQAAANALPIKDIFAVIFFLSVGMLFNPEAIGAHFSLFLGIIAIILLVKPLVAYLIAIYLGYSLNTALTVAISLAQIGEFSFILAEEAIYLKLIPDEGFDLLVACAIISIFLNPIYFKMIGYFEPVLQKYMKPRNAPLKSLEPKKDFLSVIVVGYGPIGRDVARVLKHSHIDFLILEQNIDTVSNMEKDNSILFGDAADAHILKEARIEEASHLLITIPDTEKTVQIIHEARRLNPNLPIVARIQYITEKPLFEELGVKYICAESESLKAFASYISHLFHKI